MCILLATRRERDRQRRTAEQQSAGEAWPGASFQHRPSRRRRPTSHNHARTNARLLRHHNNEQRPYSLPLRPIHCATPASATGRCTPYTGVSAGSPHMQQLRNSYSQTTFISTNDREANLANGKTVAAAANWKMQSSQKERIDT